MKTVFEFFSSNSFQIVGYTLLHSLWQGLLTSIIVAAALRSIPSKLSNTRYAVATVGLMSMVFISLVTYIYLSAASPGHTIIPANYGIGYDSFDTSTTTSTFFANYLTSTQGFIESSLPLFLMIWVAGALIFSLRIFMGLTYVERLREESVPLGKEWINCIHQISRKLKMAQVVDLAESAIIDAPLVIGFLKPIVLLPIGMCSSLSTAQLETIFIHELMHIKRRDYLVNLIQSFVEAIYFFNPFVWAISNMVRSEREHCCDDAVVQVQGNPAVYASALATLEEVRLSKKHLSLSLAGNKNELLKRIKRLMEKSVQNHYGGGRMIPALLLVIGLVCASWISTKTESHELDAAYNQNAEILQDTTKKNKKAKAGKKSQRNRATSSADNKEVEIDKEVEVEKDVQVEERVETDDGADFSYSPPPLPEFNFEFQYPPMPDMAGMMPPLAELNLLMKDFENPHFDWNDGDWEKFSEEFEEKFKLKFGDFYEKNEEDIQKMMDEIQQNLSNKLGEDFESKMEDFARQQERWAREHAEKWQKHAEKMSLHSDQLERMSEDIHRRSEGFQQDFEKNHHEFEKRHQAFEDSSRNFQKVLKEELIKDGYLDKGEKLESIEFYNGVLKINGKDIKSEDRGKYNEIRKHYFGNSMESDKVD